MHLIVLCGPPASGKLSIARDLAKLNGYRVFHNHLVVDLLESIFEFGSGPFVELRDQLWSGLICRVADEGTPGVIFTLTFDQTLAPDFSTRIADGFSRENIEVSFVELCCSSAELERRVVSAERGKYSKLVSVQRYRELLSLGAFARMPLPANTTVFDTTGLSIQASAAKIHQLFSARGPAA